MVKLGLIPNLIGDYEHQEVTLTSNDSGWIIPSTQMDRSTGWQRSVTRPEGFWG